MLTSGSAESCGCDEGAEYVCQRHLNEAMAQIDKEMQERHPGWVPPEYMVDDPPTEVEPAGGCSTQIPRLTPLTMQTFPIGAPLDEVDNLSEFGSPGCGSPGTSFKVTFGAPEGQPSDTMVEDRWPKYTVDDIPVWPNYIVDDLPTERFTVKDSGKRMEFYSGSVRDTAEGKIKWSRITFGPMMRRWAQHLTTAEAKYPDIAPGVPNFSLIETEEELVRYKESAFRHFMSWFHGEVDEDHAASLMFNVNGVEMIKEKLRGTKL